MRILINTLFLMSAIYFTAFSQVYNLSPSEKIVYSYLLNSKDYAFVLEREDNNTKDIFYDIIHNDKRLNDFTEFKTLKILSDGMLVATMIKPSVAKDVATFIYGDEQRDFDSIEKVIYSDNSDQVIVFAKDFKTGVVLINNIEQDHSFDEIFNVALSKDRFAYSYIEDDIYYINIDGVQTQLAAKADNIHFSKDATRLVYVLVDESGSILIENDIRSEAYNNVGEIVFAPNNMLAYTATIAPYVENSTNTNQTNIINNDMSTNIIENSTNDYQPIIDTTNYNNIQNYEAITVLGPSNTVALVNIENTTSNLIDVYNSYNAEDYTNEFELTNMIDENIPTSVFLDGHKFYEFEEVTNISFSPNSKQLIFVIKENEKYKLSIAGKMSEEYNKIQKYLYSPNSRQFILSTREDDSTFIYLNDDMIYEFEAMNNIYISDYILAFSINKNNRQVIISDDFESPSYSDIFSFIFSKDMKSFSFSASRMNKYYQFYFSTKNPTRKESYGYDYISDIFLSSNMDEEFITLALKDETLYILKNGVE